MGLLDEVYCEMPLPDDAPEFLKKCPAFQTYDLGRGMGNFTITKDGILQLTPGTFDLSWCFEITGVKPIEIPPDKITPIKPIPMNYKRKRLEIHATNLRAAGPQGDKYVYYTDDGSDCIDISYIVQIRNGRVSSIKENGRDTKPALLYHS